MFDVFKSCLCDSFTLFLPCVVVVAFSALNPLSHLHFRLLGSLLMSLPAWRGTLRSKIRAYGLKQPSCYLSLLTPLSLAV
jgi:hypothetical protein